VIRTAQFVFRFEATLITVRQREVFMGSPFPAIPCVLCSNPVNLISDLYADENGKAVHEECYVNRITETNSRASISDD
jgi:hypothetical protein